jgi:hypothetical protein
MTKSDNAINANKETKEQITLSQAIENTVAYIAALAKKYSMKQDTVLAVLTLEIQLMNMAEQKAVMGGMKDGQALVDAIGEEQAAKRREADEVISE